MPENENPGKIPEEKITDATLTLTHNLAHTLKY